MHWLNISNVTTAKLGVKHVMECMRALELDGLVEAVKPLGGVQVPEVGRDGDGRMSKRQRLDDEHGDGDEWSQKKERERLKAKERLKEKKRREREKEKEREKARKKAKEKEKEKERAKKRKRREKDKKDRKKHKKKVRCHLIPQADVSRGRVLIPMRSMEAIVTRSYRFSTKMRQ